jgi:hypothetical protein
VGSYYLLRKADARGAIERYAHAQFACSHVVCRWDQGGDDALSEGDRDTVGRYSFLFKGCAVFSWSATHTSLIARSRYKAQYYWWESTIMMRKGIIMTLSVFLRTEPQVQAGKPQYCRQEGITVLSLVAVMLAIAIALHLQLKVARAMGCPLTLRSVLAV